MYPTDCPICRGPCVGGPSRADVPQSHPLYWEHMALYQVGVFDHYEYWRQRPAGPPPPKDPAFWCEAHQRPLTWQETHRAELPQCSWCNPYPEGYQVPFKKRTAGADD